MKIVSDNVTSQAGLDKMKRKSRSKLRVSKNKTRENSDVYEVKVSKQIENSKK